MIIAAIVISVLSIAVSGYSFVMTRRAAKAREETDRLRAERQATPWPVIEFSGTVTPEAEARLREAIAREWRRGIVRASHPVKFD